jgi:hypothetical protein
MTPDHGYRCSRCKEWHPELPLAYSAELPDLWHMVSDEQRARSVRSSDQCVIDGRYYFIQGCIEVPVLDGPGPLVWGVWVSLSEASFRRACELWETPGREAEPPCFGWLNTQLPGYPTVVQVKTMVHNRPVGERPWVEVEAGGHPVAAEQCHGITRARVQEIAEAVLHGELPGAAGSMS